MMQCGHAANATVKDKETGESKPCCVICAGISAGWDVVATSPPDLSGRKAKCSYCNRTRDSAISLAFFEHRPDEAFDDYYCGCRGWD
jgi:hypothetical protein